LKQTGYTVPVLTQSKFHYHWGVYVLKTDVDSLSENLLTAVMMNQPLKPVNHKSTTILCNGSFSFTSCCGDVWMRNIGPW